MKKLVISFFAVACRIRVRNIGCNPFVASWRDYYATGNFKVARPTYHIALLKPAPNITTYLRGEPCYSIASGSIVPLAFP